MIVPILTIIIIATIISIDKRTKNHHVQDIYQIYNEKIFMVRDAILMNPFSSKKYAWVDIGCIRVSETLYYIHNFPYHANIDDNRITVPQSTTSSSLSYICRINLLILLDRTSFFF